MFCILIITITKSILPILTSAFNYVQYYSWAYLCSNLIIFTACPLPSLSWILWILRVPVKTYLCHLNLHMGDPLDGQLSSPPSPGISMPCTYPLRPIAWGELLSSYPDQQLVQFILWGITEGFKRVIVIAYLKVLDLPEKSGKGNTAPRLGRWVFK